MPKKPFKNVLLLILLSLILLFSGCGEIVERMEAEPAPPPEVAVRLSDAESDFSIHFIDVVQGDSIFIVSGGETMLIDAGDAKYADRVIKYLEDRGIKRIDYVVGTHPHADHIGGLARVIESFEIGGVWMPNIVHTTKTYENLIDTITKKGLTVSYPNPGESAAFGLAEVSVVAPFKMDKKALNNCSIVLRIAYDGFAFLFTGDAETKVENEIIASKANISADVIKIGHHGSTSSTSENFLRIVDPHYAIILVGEDNSYGHPMKAILNRLESHGVGVFRTDEQGDIVVAVEDGEIVVKNGCGEIVSAPPVVEIKYIGNTNSKKFHLMSCASLPAENNRVYFFTRQEAVESRYDPCGSCKP